MKLEDRKKQFRVIYEELTKDFRVYIKSLAKALQIDGHTASKRLREALEKGYIFLPQLRRRSYANFKEYMYFVNCKRSLPLFEKYKEDKRVVYHAVMSGFANLWIVSNEELDIEGDIISGLRSDYYVAYAPRHPWKRAMREMQKMAEQFDPAQYEPEGIIKIHWNESLDWWDSEFEKLFREFKCNGRKTLTPVMKRHLISSGKFYKFLKRLPECCTVFTQYFPDSILAYDPYLFMFETDYEDFIVELFSQLPTFSLFFKVSNKLFVLANIERASIRRVGLNMSDISQAHLLHLVEDLLDQGILKSEAHAIVEYSWNKDF